MRTSFERLIAAGLDQAWVVGTTYSSAATEAATVTDTVAVVIPPTTLNPSDVSGTPTLSNGNLTIATSVDGTVQWARSTIGSSSPFYCELLCGSSSGSGNQIIAITNATQVLATLTDVSPNKGVQADDTGFYYSDNVPVYSQYGAAGASGNRICLVVKNGKIYVRLNAGNWNNSGTADPVTEVGGINISSIGTVLYVAVGSKYSYIPVTIAFAAGSWLYTPPSGVGALAAVSGSTYNDTVTDAAIAADGMDASLVAVARALAGAR